MGTALQVAQQWFDMADLVERLAFDVTAGRRLGGSVYARIPLARGTFASKDFHTYHLPITLAPKVNSSLAIILSALSCSLFWCQLKLP